MEERDLGQNSACADQILGLGGHVEGVEVVGGDAAGAAVGGQASKRINEEGLVFLVFFLVDLQTMNGSRYQIKKNESERNEKDEIQAYG